jgi:hypothetical protein
MSVSLWCDIDDTDTNAFGQHGHAFSGNDPDRRHFVQTAQVRVPVGNSYGNPVYQDRQQVTEELDMCGYHWRKSNPFLAEKKTELPSSSTAQKTLQELEEEDEEYRRGYEAAEDKFYSTRDRKKSA